MQAKTGIDRRLWSKKSGKTAWLVASVLAVMLPANAVQAEHAFSIYGGITDTDSNQIVVTDLLSSPPQIISGEFDFDQGPEIGLRYTWWWQYLGLAIDVSYFTVDTHRSELINFDVIPLSLFLMLRWPLQRGPRFPRGRFHPYIGLGPSWVVYDFQVQGVSFPYGGSDGSGNEWSVSGVLGFNWQLTRLHALFLEFKRTGFNVATDDSHRYWDTPARVQVSSDLTTNHFLLGYTFKF